MFWKVLSWQDILAPAGKKMCATCIVHHQETWLMETNVCKMLEITALALTKGSFGVNAQVHLTNKIKCDSI